MKLKRLPEFTEWLRGEREKDRLQVESRLQRIADHNHFGDAKDLGDGLAELRWKSGRRVYFAIVRNPEATVVLIVGGNKNGQNQDINQARKILASYQA